MLLHIPEVPDLNLGPETVYTDWGCTIEAGLFWKQFFLKATPKKRGAEVYLVATNIPFDMDVNRSGHSVNEVHENVFLIT